MIHPELPHDTSWATSMNTRSSLRNALALRRLDHCASVVPGAVVVIDGATVVGSPSLHTQKASLIILSKRPLVHT